MQMEWQSRKGNARLHNSDAVALCAWDNKAVIALVDAAESNTSVELASRWARACVWAAVRAHDRLSTSDSIIYALKHAHTKLRSRHLHERASYLIASLDLDRHEGTLIFAGDCLLGISGAGTPVWLNTPHTVEAHYHHSSTECPTEIQGAEHILTRAFKGRRFTTPVRRSFVWSKGVSLLFSTDGHWREHLRDGVSLTDLQDDASVLCLAAGTTPLNVFQHTDASNLIIVDRDDLPDIDQEAL
ncbi:Serine/threonine protein phosphatase PrpC [Marinobacterium sediminicola]|uniref:Serine/threonine protein phosphatase PrpC n=2 Tax=Marinobacterium sediminicola TaxID=518898 RepID=A0ABY1S302_9GAMM|nr:hypothetical protein [Marinobacterium sediminicola]SMR77575.1 Serine/threonine protein phosphatase PrpC [Marinobacterium sediminicola]